MKTFFISMVLLVGLSINISAQRHPPRPPAPPVPSRGEMTTLKARELDKKYNTERKMILKHPLLSKKMKNNQLRTLNQKYQTEKRLLRSAR